MKLSKKFLTALAVPMFSAALFAGDAAECKDGVCPIPQSTQNKEAEAPKPPSKPIAKTIDESFAFLPETVAVVNGKKITKNDIIAIIKPYISEQILSQIPAEQLKQQILPLIDAEILFALVEKEGYAASQEKTKSYLDSQLAKMSPAERQGLEARGKISGKTVDEYVGEMAKNPGVQRDVALDMWVREKVLPTLKVTDEEALDFYNKHSEQLAPPETVTTAHILIRPAKENDEAADKAAKAKAESILAQIKQGADFGTLAETESACPSGKRSKGVLGQMEKRTLDADYWNAAHALKKGEMSGVVKTQFGYHIIRLDDKTEAVAPKFEEVKPMIVDMIRGEKANEAIRKVIDQAKKDGTVKVTEF